MTGQLGLPLSPSKDSRFDNFLGLSGSYKQTINFLKGQFGLDQENVVYLWGAEGSGRTHLSQAVCHHWLELDKTVQYLPLSEFREYPPEQLMADLELLDLVCIDEINLVADHSNWLNELFHFFNRGRAQRSCLLVTGDAPPAQLGLGLADLQSRLSAATVFQLPGYSDAEKIQVLQFRAKQLGLHLADAPAQFLLNRAPRQLEVLIQKLHELDRSSLVYQRRLSIPFMKQVFCW